MEVVGQQKLSENVNRIINIFKTSEANIRPHFILTGPSGSGKTHTIKTLSDAYGCAFIEINAAQLTKEGTAGNSLSKALGPLKHSAGLPVIVFVDEFDKLFISGNSNSSHAHETTTGVQNEFLKVLESDQTSIFGDYGKYLDVSVKNALFIFAGAFNGEEDIDVERLKELGVKTEFLGRVNLIYNTSPLSLEDMFHILDNSELLKNYIKLTDGVDPKRAVKEIKAKIEELYESNTLGARLINGLIHKYFIERGFNKPTTKKLEFSKSINF